MANSSSRDRQKTPQAVKKSGTVLKTALLRKICRHLVDQQTKNLCRNATFVPILTVKLPLLGPIVCPGPSGQLRAGRQDGQGNRHDEERRHVTCQVPHLPRLGDRLDGHDSSVYKGKARPHGEPGLGSDWLMDHVRPGSRTRQVCVDANDHYRVVRVTDVQAQPDGQNNISG